MRISLEDISFRAFHGLYEEEKIKGNDFLVTVHIDFEPADQYRNDEIGSTIDYTEVYQIIRNEMANPKGLLEAVISQIGSEIMARFILAESVIVSVSKLNPPIGGPCARATVTRTFSRNSSS